MNSLLDPAFARELEALRRQLRLRTRTGTGGEHASSRRGSSAEFLEHRPYTAGDDLRRMDWLAFARTGEPVLKLFRAEDDVIVRLLVDASASLDTGEPRKMFVAKRLAAAVGYMALASSERAQVLTSVDGRVRAGEPARGRGALTRLLRELDAIVPERKNDLSAAIDSVLTRSSRSGMLVVVSDFLDEGAFDAAFGRAAAAGHDLALVQVLSPEEISPPWEGDLALEDVETGEVVDVTLDARAVDAYMARLERLVGSLRSCARRYRATYVRTSTADALLPAVKRFVTRTID